MFCGDVPLFFKQLQAASAIEVVLHRMVWSLVFVLIVLAVLCAGTGWATCAAAPPCWAICRVRPAAGGQLAPSYVWAVNNGHVPGRQPGLLHPALINVALGFIFCTSGPARPSGRPLPWPPPVCCGWQCNQAMCPAGAADCDDVFLRPDAQDGPLGALGMSLETMLLAPGCGGPAVGWPQRPGSQWPAHDAHTWLFFLLSGPVTAIPLLLFAAGAGACRCPPWAFAIHHALHPGADGVFLYGETFAGPRAVGFVFIWVALALYTAEGLWAGGGRLRLWAAAAA